MNERVSNMEINNRCSFKDLSFKTMSSVLIVIMYLVLNIAICTAFSVSVMVIHYQLLGSVWYHTFILLFLKMYASSHYGPLDIFYQSDFAFAQSDYSPSVQFVCRYPNTLYICLELFWNDHVLPSMSVIANIITL